ncbi:response regulator [Deltaproteobacteria bacterium IMCC39524]|nr:response regulator [Deltaproteobacteria bacterium IMCC39524]
MSLVGNLEDLGLGEILQIVSLSRKSGVLQLNSLDRDGRVIFHDGQVIRASASTFPENIGDLVIRAGMVDIGTLKKALVIQHERDDGRRIGDILVSDFGVDREAIDTVVREQVEKIVYSFFSWDEGAFSFELGDPGELASTTLNPLQFMLDSGLNPQWLAMEGSRILDEKRHRGEDVDERGESLIDIDQLLAEVKGEVPVKASAEGPDAAATATKPPRKFIVVDDDHGTAEKIASLLQERKSHVHVFTNYNSFLEAVSQADPATTTLVIDLIMPRRDGSGVLGGLELLEEVRAQYPDFQVLVMSDHPNREAEQSVRNFGVPTLFPKPKKDDVLAERGRAGLIALVDAIIALSEASAEEPEKADGLYNIGAELLREMGEVATGAPEQTSQQSPGLHLLRGMLQELNNPSLGGGIILLILRFASELMNRAVILLVKDEEVVGLGQFGIELNGNSADVRVRNVKLPKEEDHIFEDALQSFAPYRTAAKKSEWNNYFFEQLGGQWPGEVFVGPLVSEGRVVAVLYGDNLPDEKPIGDTESLEIFLSQAGLAMEKALLERRMSKG